MVTDLLNQIDEFQALVENRPALKTGRSYDLAIERLESGKAGLKNHLVGWVEQCSQGRKAANRALVPAIQKEMTSVYANCAAETGKGGSLVQGNNADTVLLHFKGEAAFRG